MPSDEVSPTSVVYANVATYMRWRGLTQEDLAERMNQVGMGSRKRDGTRTSWHRRTVGQMLNGHRKIHVDELVALSSALETSVGALLSPRVGGVLNFDARYRIGDLESLDALEYEQLLEDLDEKESRPLVVLDATTFVPGATPQWKRRDDKVPNQFTALLARVRHENPDRDIDTMSFDEVMNLMGALDDE